MLTWIWASFNSVYYLQITNVHRKMCSTYNEIECFILGLEKDEGNIHLFQEIYTYVWKYCTYTLQYYCCGQGRYQHEKKVYICISHCWLISGLTAIDEEFYVYLAWALKEVLS